MRFAQKYVKMTSFVLGALSSLTFAPNYFIVMAFIAFSGLLYLLLCAQTRRQLFAIGYSFGFAHFAFGLSWVGNALLIDAAQFGWLYPLALTAAGAFFGLFFALPAVLTWWAPRSWQKWLAFSVGVVVFEWLRSFILTGFPWNLVGYTLAFDDRLIQAAAWGGIYILSLAALLVYSAGGLWLNSRNKQTAVFVFIICTVIPMFLWGGGYWRLQKITRESGDWVVRIVQPSIPQKMKWSRELLEENFATYVRLSGIKSQLVPDLIVWGETASPFRLDEDEYHLQKLLPVLPKNSFLAAGMISYQQVEGRYLPHNSMVVFDAEGKVLDYYHKSHLVPFGEYIPLREYLPAFIRPVANAIGTFGRGDGPSIIKVGELPEFGAIICYEAIFPHQVVNPDARPRFLINLTNDGWYGYSAGPYQHWVATKLRAVEEGITIVRAANNGISGVITPYGFEKLRLPLNYRAVADVKLDKPLDIDTFYGKFGNKIPLTFCLILLFLAVIKIENISAKQNK